MILHEELKINLWPIFLRISVIHEMGENVQNISFLAHKMGRQKSTDKLNSWIVTTILYMNEVSILAIVNIGSRNIN